MKNLIFISINNVTLNIKYKAKYYSTQKKDN